MSNKVSNKDDLQNKRKCLNAIIFIPFTIRIQKYRVRKKSELFELQLDQIKWLVSTILQLQELYMISELNFEKKFT